MDSSPGPSRRAFFGLAGVTAAALAVGTTATAAPARAADYVHLDWLGDALRAGGCTVIEQDGWLQRGRPASTGDFDPYGVLLHHTAIGTNSTSSNPAPSLDTVINGRSDLAGPLCHVLIDYNGACRLVAAGRANHAGVAKASGPMPSGDGNALYVGIEIDYNAPGQAHTAAQYDAAISAAAAIVRHYHNNGDYVRAHRETSTEGKIDPSGFDMPTVRSQVTARLTG